MNRKNDTYTYTHVYSRRPFGTRKAVCEARHKTSIKHCIPSVRPSVCLSLRVCNHQLCIGLPIATAPKKC